MSDQESGATRKRGLLLIAVAVLLGAIAYGAWWWLHARHNVTTDDAYVAGNIVQITAEVPGTISAVYVEDTQAVQKGALLLALDPDDANVAMAQSEADLARVVRELRGTYAATGSLKAELAARNAEVSRLHADIERRRELLDIGAVGNEEMAHLKSTLDSAEALRSAASERLMAAGTQTQGIEIQQHPSVLRAVARVREVALLLARTQLRAPLSGVVARRSAQLGQRINPGAPLLTLTALDALWVEANFKEVQLANMRLGQPVTLISDQYGDAVEFTGRINGFAAGTGNAFALLPAQNASGNWIKVVQRVPVRIALDAGPLKGHPLRLGLSMRVKVDVRDISGTQVAPAQLPVASAPSAAEPRDEALETRIQQLITQQLAP